MAKGIIVTNIPESCSKCWRDCDYIVRTSLCPIKDLPEEWTKEYKDDYGQGFVAGWNAYRNKILGE